MFSRQTRTSTVNPPFASFQTIEVSITFTPEELERLTGLASRTGCSLAEFIQNAALEAAHLKSPAKSGLGAGVDSAWLTEAFNDAGHGEPEDSAKTSILVPPQKSITHDAIARKQNSSKEATAKSVSESDNSASTDATDYSNARKGVLGEQSSLAKGSGPVWEIRQALGRERLHGLGWTREHLAFVLKLSVVGVRKLEHTGMAPTKSTIAKEKLLELAKAIQEPNEVVQIYIQGARKEAKEINKD